tara:strand:+ start:536 stop:1090 length:555 start_codon:yes stop_codon:yes gene_type:complete
MLRSENVLDYIIYEPLPSYYKEAFTHNKDLGWISTDLTPDSYDIEKINVFHTPFKHIKEITIPKIEKIKNNINGFFIIEGDVKININYDEFLKMNITKPTWLGYKKKLKNYIVGNFLIYIPIHFFEEFKLEFTEQKRLIFSDRFFTKLVKKNWLVLSDKSVVEEIPHHSNILNKWTNGKKSWRL